MDASELLRTLVELTLSSSVALALVMLARRPLRAAFGAGVAYLSWLLVPVAMLAVLLPAATVEVGSLAVVPDVRQQALASVGATGDDGLLTIALLAGWAAGMLATMCAFAALQRRFRRGLGRLQPLAPGVVKAEACRGLPAAIGLWRPLIVFPADFQERYSAEQLELLRQHERIHLARGDLQANALVALLRCLFWFNPLVHLGSRCFRQDQEMSCDLRVLAGQPASRRAYGEAMLKTQLAAQPLPVGCHWGHGHPMKERLEMLRKPAPKRYRWIGGSAVVCALSLSMGYAAWAAQPPVGGGGATIGLDAPSKPPAPPAPPTPPVPRAPADMPAPPTPPAPPAPPPPYPGAPPAYPESAYQAGIEGRVVLVVDIQPDGKPGRVVVESATPEGVFEQTALDAASRWRFNPPMEDGKAVPGRVRVPVDFRIPPGQEAKQD